MFLDKCRLFRRMRTKTVKVSAVSESEVVCVADVPYFAGMWV